MIVVADNLRILLTPQNRSIILAFQTVRFHIFFYIIN